MRTMDGLEQFLDNHLKIRKTVGGSGDRELVFPECPYCGDTKEHFYVNLNKRLYHCYKCSVAGSLVDLVAKLEGVSRHAAKELLATTLRPVSRRAMTEIIAFAAKMAERQQGATTPKILTDIALPKEYVSCVQGDKIMMPTYLKQRNVTPAMVKHFGVGYANIGFYKGHIIWPIKTDGSRVFVARVAGKAQKGQKKYLYPSNSNIGMFLLNYDSIPQGADLILSEGAMDVMRLWSYGLHVVGLLGKNLTSAQLGLILSKRPKKIFVMLDDDAFDQCVVLAKRLGGFIPTRIAALQGGDPDSVQREEVFRALEHPISTHSNDLLRLKLKKLDSGIRPSKP